MSDTDATLRYPTCTHDGTKEPCWYCSLPAWMFEPGTNGRLKKEYHAYATPWNAPRFWLKKAREGKIHDTP